VSDLSRDAFLGGRLFLWQPARGYRAGVDPVLLAASVPARAGQSVLDLGCGAGAALFCLATRVSGLSLTGVEIQDRYAALARRNAAEAGFDARIETADLTALPDDLRQRAFDHVVANPPYFRAGARVGAGDAGREAARAEAATPLAHWVDQAARRLAPRGYLHMIQTAARLPDMLAGLDHRLGSVEVLPIQPRAGRAPTLVILRVRKGGRAPFRLLPPFVMHEGDRHDRDADDYTPAARAILRDGAALDWPEHGRARDR
jgi:tRNA1(Val) A37 N6-methylase TrmN6